MAVNVHNLIGAIRPDLYCEPSARDEVKKILKEKGYREASEKVKPISAVAVDPDDIYYSQAIKAKGLDVPLDKHTVIYDSPGENLEPIYFWILEFLQGTGYKGITKVVDTFISSAGSGHFSEMGMKATKMQEEAMKMLSSANAVIKSILNILYDLKEFRARLEVYKKANSSDAKVRSEGILSLKQIWMDTVDMKRGNGSLNGLAQQLNFVTIRDAFMAARSTDDIRSLDLNERVKRILEARVSEFETWMKESEKELTKRYNIEKIYLKSQVSSLQLYARWMKPYIQAAKELEQKATGGENLVAMFNTSIFELTLVAEGEYDPNKDISTGDLPTIFKDKNKGPGYKPVIVVDLKFRTIPARMQNQNYVFRGKVEVTFTSYALKNDEVKILKDELVKDDINDLAGIVTGSPEESLKVIQDEVNDFLNEESEDDKKKKDDSKKKKEADENDVNPFAALFGAFSLKDIFSFGGSDKKDEKVDLSKGVPEDDHMGKVMRSQAIWKGRGDCSKIYSEFKKAQGMVS